MHSSQSQGLLALWEPLLTSVGVADAVTALEAFEAAQKGRNGETWGAKRRPSGTLSYWCPPDFLPPCLCCSALHLCKRARPNPMAWEYHLQYKGDLIV